MANTLIIDTSYGSTVGVLGHEPVVETDSRTHVERLQGNIDTVVGQAGLTAKDIDRIIVGVGPAPYTGLRVGVVTAKALAYATGARLIGQDILAPQAWMAQRARSNGFSQRYEGLLGELCQEGVDDGYQRENDDGPCHSGRRHLTLCVNDARRRQLYFELVEGTTEVCIDMDIDYPASIVDRVNEEVSKLEARDPGVSVQIDIVGHGAAKYADEWSLLKALGAVVDASVLDLGAEGLSVFAQCVLAEGTNTDRSGCHADHADHAVEPLYLRRPDVSLPNPLKHVLNTDAATGATQ